MFILALRLVQVSPIVNNPSVISINLVMLMTDGIMQYEIILVLESTFSQWSKAPMLAV